MASASLMTLAVKGSGPEEVAALAALVQELVKGAPVPASRLGDLAALSGVSRFPARVKCALLPWRALAAALSGEPGSVSTE
jgi:nitrogen fixation protein NifU and related proteins